MKKILNVKTEHAMTFKTVLEGLKEILTETNIEFCYIKDKKTDKEKGIMKILAVDTNKTVIIHLRLENFTEFECLTASKSKIVGINLNTFYKLIKSIEKEEYLTISQYIEGENVINIEVNNPDKGRTKNLSIKLIDLPSSNKIDIPQIDFDASIQINAIEFHRACAEMMSITEYVEIQCLKDRLILRCKGDSASSEIIYDVKKRKKSSDDSDDEIDYNTGVTIKRSEDNPNNVIQGYYELKNIVIFKKFAQLCDDILIYMKNDKPFFIKYVASSNVTLMVGLTPIKLED